MGRAAIRKAYAGRQNALAMQEKVH